MLPIKKVLGFVVALALAIPAFASGGEGVAPAAEALFKIGPLPVTNSMVTSWVIAAILVIVIRIAVGRPKLIPSRGQAMVEHLVEGLFLFILIQNWSGLLPGMGTIFKADENGQWRELIRPGNADMNGTIALAVVAMLAWLYLIIRYAGPKAIFLDIFGNKADKRETPAVIYYPLFIIFFAVGLLEIISIAFRPVSLSFRLFGNVFGGENLIHAMSGMQRWGLPIPFYFLEVLIGFVQAFVFTLLVSVYIGLICNHGDEHHEEHAADH
jgi:F-type H+-transporting ATPase subunit a